MSGRLPDGGVHENCAVDADVVGAFGDELFPPSGFDVVFERNAERTVVPRVGETAVYVAAGKDESAVLQSATSLSIVSLDIKHLLKDNSYK